MAKKVLIIDDDPHIVKLLESRLKVNNYQTVIARDGQEGLDKARQENPDLILLDLMLPKISGYKLCRILKFDQRYKNIPIIMFTARVQENDQKLGFEVGADAYITKPFKPELLLTKMSALLKDKTKK